ncbi:hypothetical protein KQ51_01467 [Candidatus Izimaplasma bacterium HR1]|uniref:metallophosphoesterase family protein n=1 Tax=Candidatus Izimoplasma sp. HR1 TaxID=1541959 RepID=UPI0004F6A8DD|nr:hypothetical protein KQ51_01467 [Candidatus Izimaplasma bacterium HR1]
MKVVVFSDAHGDKLAVDRIIDWNSDTDYFLSMGDTELPLDYLVSHDVVMIKGNSRHDAGFMNERMLEIDGVKLFMTHGHKYNVHRSLDKLAKLAYEKNYDVVLFGHTHILEIEKVGKVQFLNPGSCAKPRNALPPTYMILDITEGELTWTIKDSIDNSTIEV